MFFHDRLQLSVIKQDGGKYKMAAKGGLVSHAGQ